MGGHRPSPLLIPLLPDDPRPAAFSRQEQRHLVSVMRD
jgi:hypothetical protein